jgi:hypothetical protein
MLAGREASEELVEPQIEVAGGLQSRDESTMPRPDNLERPCRSI